MSIRSLFLLSLMPIVASCFYEGVSPERQTSRDATRSIEGLKREVKALKGSNEALRNEHERHLSVRRGELKNPSWQELHDFLLSDDTNEFEYKKDEFDCNGFALRLRDNAFLRGFRSAYVFAGYQNEVVGHALNKFQLDTGETVYVDNTQRDRIAYVEKGRPYKTLPLEAVMQRFLVCLDRECHILTEETFRGDVFSYAYVDDFARRQSDLDRSIVIFNAAMRKTQAVRDNLQSIKDQHASGIAAPSSGPNIVATIEEYWN